MRQAQVMQMLLLQLTQFDEVNMVICHIAHILFNIPTKIARIRSNNFLNPEYENLFTTDNIPIDVLISPEREIGESVLKNLALPGAFEILEFADKKISLLGVSIEESFTLVNQSLGSLDKAIPRCNMYRCWYKS